MANSLTKVEQIAWEEACEAFENSNVFAANADIYKPDSGQSALAGQTMRIPYANQIESSTGLDVSSSIKDVADISVPISLAEADIRNSTFALSVNESLVSRRKSDNVKAAVRKLSSDISVSIHDLIIARGSLVGAETVALTDYKHFAKAGTMLSEVGANSADSFMYIPSRTAMGVANELGMRQTDNARDMRAYGVGELPSIGGFETYQVNTASQVAAALNWTVVVNGANQYTTPVAYNSDGGYASTESDDVRTQALTVTNTTLSVSNGDCFTIAGVNRVNLDTKEDTGQLMTFRCISGGGTTALVISPAIVATGAYQNVSAVPANGASLTRINTAAVAPTVFTVKDAVKLYCSDLDWSAMDGSAGTVLGTYTTDSGIQVAFLKQGNIATGQVTYRLSTWCKPNIVDPLRCGILLPSQAAAI